MQLLLRMLTLGLGLQVLVMVVGLVLEGKERIVFVHQILAYGKKDKPNTVLKNSFGRGVSFRLPLNHYADSAISI